MHFSTTIFRRKFINYKNSVVYQRHLPTEVSTEFRHIMTYPSDFKTLVKKFKGKCHAKKLTDLIDDVAEVNDIYNNDMFSVNSLFFLPMALVTHTPFVSY